jgi:hypothetical protein
MDLLHSNQQLQECMGSHLLQEDHLLLESALVLHQVWCWIQEPQLMLCLCNHQLMAYRSTTTSVNGIAGLLNLQQ